MALTLGVPTRKVFGWEGIDELPTLDEFAFLCDYYNVDPTYLMYGRKDDNGI